MTALSHKDRPRPAIRWAINLLVVFHLLAVFLPPLAFQARGPLGSSPSVQTLSSAVRGYGEFLYLNRGYAFFAPDAGPSHLIQAAISDEDGNRAEQMFPDRRRHWPRLLYHRHFMLAEFLHDAYQPPLPADAETLAEAEPEEYNAWRLARTRYEQIRQSMVDHLASVHPDQEVAIRRIEHGIPSFIDFNRETVPLDDERYYRVLLDRPIEELPTAPIASPADPRETAGEPTADPRVGPAESGRSGSAEDRR